MSVDCASMTSGTTGETPAEEPPVETPAEELVPDPVSLPASLGVVGYAAFALLQPVPLSAIVPFPLVVTAVEAEASSQVPVPASEPVPEPEPEDIVAVFAPAAPPAPEPAVSYAVGGYRPAPGPQTWGREQAELATAPDGGAHEVEAPADDSVLQELAVLGELDQLAPGVTAVPVTGPDGISGYAAKPASADRQARQVLDELSFLFDGS
jgi:hypothetical protein